MNEGVAQRRPQVEGGDSEQADEDGGGHERQLDVEERLGNDGEQDEREQVTERGGEWAAPSARPTAPTHVAKLSGLTPQRRERTTRAHMKEPTHDELTDAAIMPETSTRTHS